MHFANCTKEIKLGIVPTMQENGTNSLAYTKRNCNYLVTYFQLLLATLKRVLVFSQCYLIECLSLFRLILVFMYFAIFSCFYLMYTHSIIPKRLFPCLYFRFIYLLCMIRLNCSTVNSCKGSNSHVSHV